MVWKGLCNKAVIPAKCTDHPVLRRIKCISCESPTTFHLTAPIYIGSQFFFFFIFVRHFRHCIAEFCEFFFYLSQFFVKWKSIFPEFPFHLCFFYCCFKFTVYGFINNLACLCRLFLPVLCKTLFTFPAAKNVFAGIPKQICLIEFSFLVRNSDNIII